MLIVMFAGSSIAGASAGGAAAKPGQYGCRSCRASEHGDGPAAATAAAGSCVAYARSVPQLAEDLLSQQPTVLISVPRIYERVAAKLEEVLATLVDLDWIARLSESVDARQTHVKEARYVMLADPHQTPLSPLMERLLLVRSAESEGLWMRWQDLRLRDVM